MMAMCATAVVAAAVKGQGMNLVAGVLTAYLVTTGLLAVRPASSTPRLRAIALAAVALALGSTLTALGLAAAFSPTCQLFGHPPLPYLLFGVLGLVGGAGDWRIVRQGHPKGPARLARHLWRMCMALFIAVVSFVSIRERVASLLPEPFASPAARALPVLLVVWAMVYWLWRVRRPRAALSGQAQVVRAQGI